MLTPDLIIIIVTLIYIALYPINIYKLMVLYIINNKNPLDNHKSTSTINVWRKSLLLKYIGLPIPFLKNISFEVEKMS